MAPVVHHLSHMWKALVHSPISQNKTNNKTNSTEKLSNYHKASDIHIDLKLNSLSPESGL